MNTQDARFFGNVLSNALCVVTPQEIEQIDREIATEWAEEISKVIGAEGEPVDPMRREAALRAWEKRDRGAGDEQRRKAEAHREAGSIRNAQIAERKAAIADARHQRRIQVLQEHRAKHGMSPAKFTPGFPVAPKKDPKPAGVAAKPPQVAADVQQAPPPPPAPKPVERKHEGNWDDVKGKHREERERLHHEGFERVEVSPLEERPDGKHVAREVLHHPDGRKVEHHVEFDSGSGKGTFRSVAHAAPQVPGFQPGAVGKEILGGWRIHLSHAGAKNLVIPHEEAALAFVEKLPDDRNQLKARMDMAPEQGAIGKTWFVKDEAGKNVGIWKHIKSDRLYGGVVEAHRELANYRIAQSMGLSVAPPVIPLNKKMPDGEAGSHFMGFVKDAVEAGKSRNPAGAVTDINSIHELVALDVLTGQPDRHGGNWMITKDGKAVGIDSGFAFAYGNSVDFHGYRGSDSPRGVLSYKGKNDPNALVITPQLKAKLNAITDKHIDDIMKPLGFDPGHIDGAKKRLKILQNMTHLTQENFHETRKKMAA